MRILPIVVSLFLVAENTTTHTIATAFIPSSRQQQALSHSNAGVVVVVDNRIVSRFEHDRRATFRVFATPPSTSSSSSSDQSESQSKQINISTSSNTKRSEKRTTELRAATGISLPPASPSIASSSPPADEHSNSNNGLGVLFLNLGGPTTGDDVEEFLFNLFKDPDIIQLPGPLRPLQNLIATFIAKRRAPKSRAAYASIGGGSPILQYTNAQAKLLSESFSEKYGMPIKTYVGMRYWKPYTEEALQAIRKDKIRLSSFFPCIHNFPFRPPEAPSVSSRRISPRRRLPTETWCIR